MTDDFRVGDVVAFRKTNKPFGIVRYTDSKEVGEDRKHLFVEIERYDGGQGGGREYNGKYLFIIGKSDIVVLKRAQERMQKLKERLM